MTQALRNEPHLIFRHLIQVKSTTKITIIKIYKYFYINLNTQHPTFGHKIKLPSAINVSHLNNLEF